MSQLTTNTTTIDELITIANNLPDAGGGGSSGGVETCTVVIEASAYPTIVYYVDPKTNDVIYWITDGPGDYPAPFETYNNSIVYIAGVENKQYDGGKYVEQNTVFVNPGAGGTCTIS